MDIDFNLDFNLEDKKIKNSFIKIRHEIKPIKVKYSNAEKLALDIDIKKGESLFINVTGDFVFGDFIGAFIQENNLQVKELTIISLSGGIENFEMFEALIDQGWVDKINLMLSGYFMRTEMKKHTGTIQYLAKISERKKENFKIFYTNIHSKIVLIETKQGGKVTMSGSANLRSSQSLEQLIIQENSELYDFQYNYFKQLTNKK